MSALHGCFYVHDASFSLKKLSWRKSNECATPCLPHSFFFYNHRGCLLPTSRLRRVRSSNLVVNLAMETPSSIFEAKRAISSKTCEYRWAVVRRRDICSVRVWSRWQPSSFPLNALSLCSRTRWPGQLAWLLHELFVFKRTPLELKERHSNSPTGTL